MILTGQSILRFNFSKNKAPIPILINHDTSHSPNPLKNQYSAAIQQP